MTKSEINPINSADVSIDDLTSSMQEYLKVKHQHPDKILLYQLGDFYETFFEDAYIMSKELELTLTGREQGGLGRIPLAGIPIKAVNNYLEKLVQKNYKVVICDQFDDVDEKGKPKIGRRVVRVVTSGTLTESDLLKQNSNNYICALFNHNNVWGFSYADISTGEFKVTQAPFKSILSELVRISPAEVIGPSVKQEIKPFQIVPDEKIDLPDEITKLYNCTKIPPEVFEENFSLNNLKSVFQTNSLESFGYERYKIGFRAAGALLAYAWENMKNNVPKFERIEPYELSEYMILDGNTHRNLELTETLREKNKYGSLLWAIDKTHTNMGARLLKNWICLL